MSLMLQPCVSDYLFSFWTEPLCTKPCLPGKTFYSIFPVLETNSEFIVCWHQCERNNQKPQTNVILQQNEDFLFPRHGISELISANWNSSALLRWCPERNATTPPPCMGRLMMCDQCYRQRGTTFPTLNTPERVQNRKGPQSHFHHKADFSVKSALWWVI